MAATALISIDEVFKSFIVGAQEVPILKGVSFQVFPGDFLIIFGPSGCGKSTLLHIMLGLESPSRGAVRFLDKNLYATTTEDDRSEFRKKHVGMVYQQPNWIKSLTVLENTLFPLLLMGKDRSQGLEKAKAILKTVDMLDWADYIPTELSSGQQQRIALARALAINPEVIVADEPTGNLDYESGQKLMQILSDLNQQQSKTIIMVTHDLEYLRFAKTAVRMFNGEIIGQYSEKDKMKLLTEVKSKRGTGIDTHGQN